MARFRKRPVEIEAVQWFKAGDHPHVMTLEAYAEKFGLKSPHRYSPNVYVIPTLEGYHDVQPGDWIITGVQGEHYPCKPYIFEATYERVAAAAERQCPSTLREHHCQLQDGHTGAHKDGPQLWSDDRTVAMARDVERRDT